MKKIDHVYGIILLALLITAGIGGGRVGFDKGVTEVQIDRIMGSGFVADNQYTTEIRPIFAISIDDCRDDLVCMAPGAGIGDPGYRGVYWPYLINGIPVTLSINYDLLDGAGRATSADILRIIAEFDSAGVAIEIASHSNNNFSGVTPGAFTLAQLEAEIDPSDLEALVGRDVNIWQISGDAVQIFRENYWEVRDLLIQYGFKYANQMYDNTNKTVRHPSWIPGNDFTTSTPVTRVDYVERAIFPGCSDDPWSMPATRSIDITLPLERDYSITPWGAVQRYDSWTHLADGDGTPADTDWVNSVNALLQACVADSWGMVFAMHDSLTGGAQFSHHAFAAMLARYRDEGLIRLGSMEQVFDWGMSEYAPGINLLPDAWYEFIGETTGDTVGVEYLWLPGFGSLGYGAANYNAATVSDLTHASSVNGKFDRAVFNPYDIINDGVAAWADQTGGAALVYGVGYDHLWLQRTNLPLGRYVLTFNSDGQYAFNRKLETAVGVVVNNLNRRYAGGGGPTLLQSYDYSDTVLVTFDEGTGGGLYLVQDGGGVKDRQFSISLFLDPSQSPAIDWTNSAVARASSSPIGPWFGGISWQIECGTSTNTNVSRVRLLYLGKP